MELHKAPEIPKMRSSMLRALELQGPQQIQKLTKIRGQAHRAARLQKIRTSEIQQISGQGSGATMHLPKLSVAMATELQGPTNSKLQWPGRWSYHTLKIQWSGLWSYTFPGIWKVNG